MGQVIIGELGAATNRRLDDIVTDAANKVAGYKLADDYYEGRHRIKLTARARKYLQASGQPYAHNFCERVVDAVEDKLIIDGVTVKVTFADDQAQQGTTDEPGTVPTSATPPAGEAVPAAAATPADAGTTEAEDADDAGKTLTEWLEQYCDLIGFDEIASVVHHDVTSKGDGYAQPYYDIGNKRPEITWEGPENCVPFYVKGKPHQLECVAKTWVDAYRNDDGAEVEQVRVNLFYADRIEKFVQVSAGDWRRWWDEEDGFDQVIDAATVSEDGSEYDTIHVPRWPLPWVRAAEPGQTAEPRGIGFGHFRNKSGGKRYGTSELSGTVFPQQDAINKRMIDLDLVNDNQGYSQRWATGVAAGSKLLIHPGAWVSSTNKEAKFGQFPAGDPTGIIKTIETQVQHLAGTTATPLHQLLILGTPPSGEALKTAEGPFVSKLERKQKALGRVWSQVLLQVLQIALDHGMVQVDGLDRATITIEVHWKSAETRNDKEHWETQLLKQQAGVSQATTLEEDGYPIEREMERRAAETTAHTAALTASVNRGGELGDNPA